MKKKSLTAIAVSVCLLFSMLLLAAAKNLPGDVDGNGIVNAADARLCLRRAVGLETYAPGTAAFEACDVIGDGQITAADARLILRAAVGLETLGGQPDPLLPSDYTANNEYDIYRGGTFYLVGTMTQNGETQPMEIGKNSSVMYCLTEMEGTTIAMQFIGSDVYLILPSKNVYYKLDKNTMSLIGIDMDELTDSMDMGDLPALSEADRVTEGILGSQPCRTYTFDSTDGGHMQVHMAGDRFLGLDCFNASWVRTESLRIDSITKALPAKVTTPGGGARRILLFTTFMSYLA